MNQTRIESRVAELESERQQHIDLAKQIHARAERENRSPTQDEQEKFDLALRKARRLKETRDQMPTRVAQKPESDAGNGHNGNEGMNMNEYNDFSIVRAIRAAANNDWSEAEHEREISKEIASKLGRQARGFFVPVGATRRDLVKGTPSAGGDTVATDLLSESFIDMLRNRMVVQNAGATVLTDLVGDVAIPRQIGGSTAYWVAESGSPTESQATFDQVNMTPKTVGAFTDLSRKLLLQSSLDAENLVRTDLSTVLALAIDKAALHGAGANNEPRGIAATSGIGSVVGGTNGLAPAWSHIVGLETEVAIDNADIGKLAYVTNSKVRGKMKVTPKVATTDSIMLWGDNNSPVNGYNALVSNQVASDLTKGSASAVCSAIFFGNWADLLIGMWGTLDLLVDPYTGGTAGTVRVIALQDVDIAVRHAESFSLMADALTS